MDNAAKKRMQEMLLEEVKTGKMTWWYISVADADEFIGGYFIEARGPTEAWTLLHRLGWFPYDRKGADTMTIGPIDQEEADTKVPKGMRWRRLSKEEMRDM